MFDTNSPQHSIVPSTSTLYRAAVYLHSTKRIMKFLGTESPRKPIINCHKLKAGKPSSAGLALTCRSRTESSFVPQRGLPLFQEYCEVCWVTETWHLCDSYHRLFSMSQQNHLWRLRARQLQQAAILHANCATNSHLEFPSHCCWSCEQWECQKGQLEKQ